jgi:signal transduction histidine kinase
MEDERDRSAKMQREKTDLSLRAERKKVDARVADKRDVREEEADDVIRVARDRADEIVKAARSEADADRGPATAGTMSSDRERARADDVLEHERSIADATLEVERAERRRYLTDFIAVEREATDADLIVERIHADIAIAARDEFLATVSHDLRTLLGGLSLTASLIQSAAPTGADGDDIRRHTDRTARMVSRMNRLINDLLDITSIEAGRLAVLPEIVEISEILRETVEAFEPIAAAKQITLEVDAEAFPSRAHLDGGRILQVLANLVSNAIKFTPAHGRVGIHIRGEDAAVRFTVSDNGIGIAADALPTVFDRYRQVSTDRRGLGLGLYISKSIVEAHGGRLWAESQRAAGSSFHFTLPI